MAKRQQIATKEDHGDDGRNLDQGKPELGFSIGFDAGQVNAIDRDKTDQSS